MPLENLKAAEVALPSGRRARLQPTAAKLVLESGEVVIITGTLPTFPVPPEAPPGTVEFTVSELVDIAVGLLDKLTSGDGGGGGGGGGDKVTVTVEGGRGKKVTVIIE